MLYCLDNPFAVDKESRGRPKPAVALGDLPCGSTRTGKVNPWLLTNSFTAAGSSVLLMASTANSSRDRLSNTAWKWGSSSTQPSHCVTHTLTITVLPRESLIVTLSPSTVCSVKSGAMLPISGPTSGGSVQATRVVARASASPRIGSGHHLCFSAVSLCSLISERS